VTPFVRAVLDGLMLAGAEAAPSRLRLLVRPRAWSVLSNAADRAGLRVQGRVAGPRIDVSIDVSVGDRWRVTPPDVASDPVTLALWFAARGKVSASGYTIVLGHGRHAAPPLVACLGRHGIEAEVSAVGLQITRPGDRVMFRRLVAPYVALPTLKEQGQAPRRRPPLPTTDVETIRQRIASGEAYADIAQSFAINPRTVGKIARGETHVEPSVCIVRRRAPVKRLTRDEEAKVHALAEDGLSQHAIAHLLGVNQPRICRLLRRRAA
jgi:hypothetical protein